MAEDLVTNTFEAFVECASLSIQYNIMGIATVNYTIISPTVDVPLSHTFKAGGILFEGYITSVAYNKLENTNAYSIAVSLTATAEKF